jgi:STE24 endopeptidase
MAANAYFWIVLATLVGFYALDSLANWLNLHSLESKLPPGFSDVYDEAEYARMQDYTRVKTKFGLIESTFDLGVTLAFWFLGGFQYLDQLVRAWNYGPIITGLLFIAILALGRLLLSLPFQIHDTFVIEQQFGFNKTTPATFIADFFKSIALGAILGGALISIVLALFEYGGSLAWLYGWLATSALMLALTYIAPAVILPLFNKFTPLEEGPLRNAILDYTKANNFPVAGLFVMDGSKRSTKSNAFFTGLGKTKKIALFDTLVASHAVNELVAVLAHEIGHYKLRHIIKHMLAAVANLGVFFFLASLFIHNRSLFDAFGLRETSVYCGLALFLLLFTPLSRLLSMLAGFLSRKHEFDADRFAAETTHQPQAMIDALKKLSKTNLANLLPHPLYVMLYHSHPPILQRIEAIKRLSV